MDIKLFPHHVIAQGLAAHYTPSGVQFNEQQPFADGLFVGIRKIERNVPNRVPNRVPKLVVRRKIRIEKEKRLRAVWEAAGGSVGCVVPAAAAWEAGQVVAQLRTLRETVRENEQLMRGAAQRFPEYACLLSIPGFGPVVSSMVLGAVGEANRFQDRRQVLRLAGLDLSASRSGKKSDGVAPVISKQGKAALRYALVQAATIASNANPVIRRYFGGLVKGREVERGIIMKMKVKLAAKLLVIAWTLMKHRQLFNPACFAA